MLFIMSALLGINLLSCQQSWEPVGTYKSAIPEMGDRLWLKYIKKMDRFTAGSMLELRADGTYTHKSCATTTTGKWQRQGHMLLLFQATKEWNIDSLKMHGFEGKQPKIAGFPDSLYWNGSALEHSRLFVGDETIYKAVDWLKPLKQP
ncbi:MAG: hypothetical protein C0424_12340 [Sphingobacteriaceae bacterium]|nr:hypothetical protein [Sphingobacteriaceae bacterium]